MKVKVYSVAIDGNFGTLSSAFSELGKAWEFIIHNLCHEDDKPKANELLSSGQFGQLDEYLRDTTDGLDTWCMEEVTLDLPVCPMERDALSEALEATGKDDGVRECAVDLLLKLNAVDDQPTKKPIHQESFAIERMEEFLKQCTPKNPLPADPDEQNEERASWAKHSLLYFMECTKTDAEDALKDLLTDLIHLCDRTGQDFETAVDTAKTVYTEETHSNL